MPALGVPEPQMVDQLVAMIKLVDSVVPEQIIAVPKISWPSRFPRTVLREPQKVEQLVEVLVPVLGPLGGDLQAHGSYVAWWFRMAPHRQPRAVHKYWARTSSTHRWNFVVAAVTTATHSANCAVLGVRGELQRQVPAVLNRLWTSL